MSTPMGPDPDQVEPGDDEAEQRRQRRLAEQERVRSRLRRRESAIPQVDRESAESEGDTAAADSAAEQAGQETGTGRAPRGSSTLIGAGVDEMMGVGADAQPVAAPGPAAAEASPRIPRVDDVSEVDSGDDSAGSDSEGSSSEGSDEAENTDPALFRDTPMEMADAAFSQVDPPGTEPVQISDPPDPADDQAVIDEAKRRRTAATEGYAKSVKDQMRDPANRAAEPGQRAQQIMGAHDHYAQLMVLNCVKPLTQNVGPREMVESVTAVAVLWALSPKVQDLVKTHEDKIKQTLRSFRKDKLAEDSKTPLGSSKAEMEAAENKAKREDVKLRKRTDQTLAPGYEVFDVDGAATTLLAMDEALYENVRDGDDYVQAKASHDQTVDMMLAGWQKQGLSPGEIKAQVWRKIGQQAAIDPSVASRYWHTFRGDLRPSARGVDGSWDGKWVTADGTRLDPEASALFVVRMPLDPDQHLIQMSSMIEADLQTASRRGPEALREVLIGHRSAWELRDQHITGARPGSATSKTSPDGDARAAVGRAQAGLMAMTDDAIHPELRQAVAAGAVTRAYEKFAADHPEAMAAFVDKYPDGVTDHDLEQFIERARQVASPLEQGPILDSEKIDNPALTAWEQTKRDAGVNPPARVAEPSRQPPEPEQIPVELEGLGAGHSAGDDGKADQVRIRPEPHPDHRPDREQLAAAAAQAEKSAEADKQPPVPKKDPTIRPGKAPSPGNGARGSRRIPRQAGSLLDSARMTSASTAGDSDRGGRTDMSHQPMTWIPSGTGRPPVGLPNTAVEQPAPAGPEAPPAADDKRYDDPTTPEKERRGQSSSRYRQLRTLRGNRINPDRGDQWSGPDL